MARLPDVPHDLPWHHQQFFKAIRDTLNRISPPDQPPGKPSNLTVKPMPGGNEITFTGGDGADSHLLLTSDQATWDPGKADNHIIDLGLSTQHTHMVGMAGVDRYYWVVAQRGGTKSDPPTGPERGTTLALGVQAQASKFVPLSPQVVKNQQTGKAVPLISKRSGYRTPT
jgi:hypothetical protein